jgi:RNA:NAD 2'-phosphotransferase (TPT1/KptA family)/8-oxo-dGTP pyrophosphatase MutT (NUDIX family)
MAFLLCHRPEVGRLELDEHGWAPVLELCAAMSRVLKHEVSVAQVQGVIRGPGGQRFELRDTVVRAVESAPDSDQRACMPPDVLYHATTEDQLDIIRARGSLSHGRGRMVYLSSNEAQAWRVAHRQRRGGRPAVLYVDTTRARRRGVRFFRHPRGGLYRATPVPVTHVLNLQDRFDLQFAAGGIPVRPDGNGSWELALIRVARRRGVTWEVAKGKLEPGEPPEIAAVREVQEEMGTDTPMAIDRFVSRIRYPFTTPDGSPRLKTVFLYLLLAEAYELEFQPKEDEGIRDVAWFPLDEAVRAVTHSSLRPAMIKARELLAYGDPWSRPASAPKPPEPPSDRPSEGEED